MGHLLELNSKLELVFLWQQDKTARIRRRYIGKINQATIKVKKLGRYQINSFTSNVGQSKFSLSICLGEQTQHKQA